MKKLLFAAYSLDVGGIETALITLVNTLSKKGYEITVVLEKKQGIFLDKIDKNIQIVEYKPSENKNILFRKCKNFINRIKFIMKYKNKFDFSACFATYSISSSFVSRVTSKNSCLWGHADYLTLFDGNEEKVKEFFIKRKYNKFKSIVFVSEEGKNSFLKIFPEMEKKTFTCNNLVDNKKIEILSNENIDYKKPNNMVTFLNVGRHDERQKRLTRIIEASKKLVQDKLNFQVLFIGDGPDNKMYRELVKKENLESNIIFLGAKENPYPYFKISDCVILTSEYEGYPVVFLESFILNKPIITTKVSDYKDVEGKYGYVTEKNVEDIYNKMKMVIENGYEIKERFNADSYNNNIIQKLEKIF